MSQSIEREPGQHILIGTKVIVTVLKVDEASVSILIKTPDGTSQAHTLSVNESRMVGPRMGVTFKSARGKVRAVLFVSVPPDVAIALPDMTALTAPDVAPNEANHTKGKVP